MNKDCDDIGVVEPPEAEPELVRVSGTVQLSRLKLGRRQRAIVQGVLQGQSLTQIGAHLGGGIAIAELSRVLGTIVGRFKEKITRQVPTARHMVFEA